MLIAIEACHANKEKRTGVEETCFQIIQHLKTTIHHDDRVVLYTNTPLKGELANLPSNWSQRVLKWPFKKGWSQVRLSLEFLKNKPDIFLSPGQLLPLVCPHNTITVVHDSAFKVFPKAYSFLSKTYLHIMNILISKKSKIIITPSQFSKQEFSKLYNYNIDNIHVVNWGYDRHIFSTSSKNQERNEQILKKYNISSPYILSIGRLETKKNTVKIINVFDKLKNRHKNLKLVLVGVPGVGYKEIKKSIDKSNFQKDILQIGWVKRDEIPYLLKNAQVFVYPSVYEGFGLPILEAMSMACPVVCSNIPVLKEIGDDAVLYTDLHIPDDFEKKIDSLLKSSDNRDKLIAKAIQKVEQFSWEKTANQIHKLLKKAS